MLVLVHAPELFRILMTASSATARFLSLAVLLLSLAPLASLYAVFFSLLGVEPSSLVLLEQQQQQDGEEWQNAAQAVVNQVLGGGGGGPGRSSSSSIPNPSASSIDWTQLANNRTALEELFKAMYSEASKHQPSHPLWMTLKELSPTALAPPATAVLSQHWSIVIPWILTFILGVVVPMILSLWSFWRQYRRGRRESAANNKKRRHKEMLKRLQGYTKLLVPTDQVLEEEEEEDGASSSSSSSSQPPATFPSPSTTDDESSAIAVPPPAEKDPPPTTSGSTQETLQWRLPLPGQKLAAQPEQQQQQQARRTIRGSCVICLNAYQLSENVSWSSNPGCVHHFHNECIAKWLTRQVDCPCCRRVFLTHKVHQHQE